MPMATTSGDWLKRQMERRNISTRAIADALGVTPKTVYDWVGNKTTVSEERVPLLAEALDVTEIEARRGLGYWVPEDSEPQPIRDAGELDEILGDLTDVLERFRRWRSEG